MDLQTNKCVMVIDGALPLGLIANTAAILGITLGKHIPESRGSGGCGRGQEPPPGYYPNPRAHPEGGRRIPPRPPRPALPAGVFGVHRGGLFRRIQGCNVYDEFIAKVAQPVEADIAYFGIGICGPKKLVNKLTGSMPLLR